MRIPGAASLLACLALASPLCPAAQAVGSVAFTNSGAPAAQADFLTGLAQLHNFEYAEAARAFQRAQKIDPDFAMAYWGEAMTYNHPLWAQQDGTAARAALKKLGPTPEEREAKASTPREKAYLRAVEVLYGDGDNVSRSKRYALAMENLHATYPDDIDGTCFFALALLGTSNAGRDVPTYMRSAALMEEVFEQHPLHPGAAHYLIHSVDDSVHAPLGLRAARAYSKIAPESPHAQHMVSHIYLALGMWKEEVEANETAIRVSNQKLRARNKSAPLPGCGHYTIWLAYGYLQQGRFGDAQRLVEACGEEARDRPEMATGIDLLDSDGTSAGSLSSMRARYLIDSGDWSGPVAAMKVNVEGVIVAEASRDFADAYGAVRYGKIDVALEAVRRAKESGARHVDAAAALGIPAEHPMRRLPAIEEDELYGLLLLRQGNTRGGVGLISKAAIAEKAIPMEFGPPSLNKPANELLGEVLLELGQAQEARAAFEAAQVIAPGRGQSLIGLSKCAALLKDNELAASVDARLAKVALRAALGSVH